MKQKFITLIYCFSVLGIFAFNSCQKNEEFKSVVVDGPKPTATFTNTSGLLAVNFTNSSANGDTYYWQFGDGSSSTVQAPVHTYKLAGYYTVVLKTNSVAGYSSTVTKTIGVASGLASVDFTITSPNALSLGFDGTTSANVASALWDFGDGTTSTSLKLMHQFPASGTYTVKLKISGFFSDAVEKTQTVTVTGTGVNLLKGGDMESTDAQYWTIWSSQKDNPPVFGYTGDKPSGSGGWGCVRFPSFANSSGSTNELIYQGVPVVAGKKYKLDALVKAPAGGKQEYIQFYMSTDANSYVEATNMFLGFNNWHGWGAYTSNTSAINGGLYDLGIANGSYGFGYATSGVYTATATGTIFVGIQVGCWQGNSNGDILIDNVNFTQVN